MTSERKSIHRRGLLGGAISAVAGLGVLMSSRRSRRGRVETETSMATPGATIDTPPGATPASTSGRPPRRKPPIWIGHF